MSPDAKDGGKRKKRRTGGDWWKEPRRRTSRREGKGSNRLHFFFRRVPLPLISSNAKGKTRGVTTGYRATDSRGRGEKEGGKSE